MKGVLVDSNVIVDVFEDDPHWADWSESSLSFHAATGPLFINNVIYSEVSVAFERIEQLEKAIRGCGFILLEIPKEALFLAGKAFLRYRQSNGARMYPLPDFFIGAQAAVLGLPLLTRDTRRFSSYFPTVQLISPQ